MIECVWLAMSDENVKGVAIVGGLSIGALAMVLGTARSIVKTRAREQTRREIAAYIAEGSMTPEQGEKLMASGERPGCGDKC